MQTTVFVKFLRFFSVGGVGFAIDMLFTWLGKEKLKWPLFWANSVGYTVGMLFRFIANRLWTFQSADPNWVRQAFFFFGFAFLGLGLVNGIIWLLHKRLKLTNFYVAKVLAMIVFFAYNFTANLLVTFQ